MSIVHTRINQFDEGAYFPRNIVEQRVRSGGADGRVRTTMLLILRRMHRPPHVSKTSKPLKCFLGRFGDCVEIELSYRGGLLSY
jgi:hypothetical protein